MPRRYSRTQRVGELIQVELAQILQKEISSSEFGLVTITEVNVSPDFSHAKIFVSTIPEEKAKELTDVLNKSARHFRFELGQRVKMRIIPEIRFVYDDTAVHGQRISTLLNKVFKNNSETDE